MKDPQEDRRSRAATVSHDREAGNSAPQVWVLLGEKAGDNGQVLALARALGWPFQRKELRYNDRYLLSNAKLGASLASLDLAGSSPLAPPWPDLVIGVGRRSVPAARWIREQSGGKAKHVQLGRPRLDLRHFDLVITTPQYALPRAANLLQIGAPLNRLDPAELAAATARWAPRLAAYPAPRIAVIAGGAAGRYAFGPEAATELADGVNRMRRACNGSLLLTTSRRTPREFADRLFAAVEEPAFRHRWSPTGENPYAALLALADRLVVTGDSASMLAEAASLGKPLYLFDPPAGKAPWSQAIWRHWDPLAKPEAVRWSPLHRLLDLAVRRGLLRPSRAMPLLHRFLIREGKLQRLDEAGLPAPAATTDDADMQAAVGRIRALFQG